MNHSIIYILTAALLLGGCSVNATASFKASSNTSTGGSSAGSNQPRASQPRQNQRPPATIAISSERPRPNRPAPTPPARTTPVERERPAQPGTAKEPEPKTDITELPPEEREQPTPAPEPAPEPEPEPEPEPADIEQPEEEEPVFGSPEEPAPEVGVFVGNIYFLPANTQRLPNFDNLEPVGTVYTSKLDIAPRQFDQGFPGISERFEWFGIRYTTSVYIDIPGKYRFRLNSDDGSKLIVNGKKVIDNDGQHAPTSKHGDIVLKEGVHEFVVEYFQGPRHQIALQLFVTPPDGDEEIFALE